MTADEYILSHHPFDCSYMALIDDDEAAILVGHYEDAYGLDSDYIFDRPYTFRS